MGLNSLCLEGVSLRAGSTGVLGVFGALVDGSTGVSRQSWSFML